MNRCPVPLPIHCALALCLALALSACGNKGALVLPDKSETTPPPAEGSAPADSAPSADEDGPPARGR